MTNPMTNPFREELSKLMCAMLQEKLGEIEASDTDYEKRYGLVLEAMYFAYLAGFQVGIGFDGDTEWPVVYIELPDGQVSWHMPAHTVQWDGHSTAEKYSRIAEFRSRPYLDDGRHPGA